MIFAISDTKHITYLGPPAKEGNQMAMTLDDKWYNHQQTVEL